VKQQRQIAHLQSFVDRFRAKATKAKQAQSRIKALERMERIAAAHVDSPFEFAFAPVDTSARQLVRLDHVTLGYEDDGSLPPCWPTSTGACSPASASGALGERRRQIDALTAREVRSPRARAGALTRVSIGYFAASSLQLDAAHRPRASRLDPARAGCATT
jgi:ATP-binding cassette subfamily F protein 3